MEFERHSSVVMPYFHPFTHFFVLSNFYLFFFYFRTFFMSNFKTAEIFVKDLKISTAKLTDVVKMLSSQAKGCNLLF